jgi:lambda repressor-like predicted transcriptional regulator
LDNEHLRTAITRAGLTIEEFADTVQVDVKTVRRWLTGRIPYPRHQTRVARALDTTEQALWPGDVPAPTATGAGEPATHTTSDAIVGYPYATDLAAPNVDELLRAATERIQIVIPYIGFDSGLVEMFRTGAPNGCRVSLMIGDPDERVEPLLGIDAIEVRASPAGVDHILFRADDEMLLVLTRIGSAGTSPPVIHLHRQIDDGLFDRLAKDFDTRWIEATPLTSGEQLPAYLADPKHEPSRERDQFPGTAPQSRPSETPTALRGEAPRRWPRRPT